MCVLTGHRNSASPGSVKQALANRPSSIAFDMEVASQGVFGGMKTDRHAPGFDRAGVMACEELQSV